MNDVDMTQYMIDIATLCTKLRMMGMSEERIMQFKINPQQLEDTVKWLEPLYADFCKMLEEDRT